MKKTHYPCVLSIAGTDPSGGAGISADIKAISATGSYAASVITALVAQNTCGVQAIQKIPPDFVIQQMESVFNDLEIAAVKIGMLDDTEIIQAVASTLEKYRPKNIVLDPVMVAKNGSELLSPQAIFPLKTKLFPLSTLITPNLFEAEKIMGEKIESLLDMEAASEKMGKFFKTNVLLKGGHLHGPESSDVLYSKENYKHVWFHVERIASKNTHGTGCTLSAAIASFLAQGSSLEEAILLAKKYLSEAIKAAKDLKIGQGYGPVHHFYFLNKK